MWNNARPNTSILLRYDSISILSSFECDACGSPGPYVTTGIFKQLPKTFMSPVPVFLINIGRVLHTSKIDSESALTRGEECSASNDSVISSILYVSFTFLCLANLLIISSTTPRISRHVLLVGILISIVALHFCGVTLLLVAPDISVRLQVTAVLFLFNSILPSFKILLRSFQIYCISS